MIVSPETVLPCNHFSPKREVAPKRLGATKSTNLSREVDAHSIAHHSSRDQRTRKITGTGSELSADGRPKTVTPPESQSETPAHVSQERGRQRNADSLSNAWPGSIRQVYSVVQKTRQPNGNGKSFTSLNCLGGSMPAPPFRPGIILFWALLSIRLREIETVRRSNDWVRRSPNKKRDQEGLE